MSRSINVSDLRFDQIRWDGDSMAVKLATTKCNQQGKDIKDKFVFANPVVPEVCPVLLLGLNIVCVPKLNTNDNRVFFGGDAANRFSKWLHAFVDSRSPEELLELGIQKHEYGVHSVRKASFSFVSCLSFIGDSIKTRLLLLCLKTMLLAFH